MSHPILRELLRSSAFVGGLILLGVAAGCESDEGPTAHERQEAAMRDPFGYNPDEDLLKPPAADEVDPTDISGGRTGELNKKALQRDLKSVFNP